MWTPYKFSQVPYIMNGTSSREYYYLSREAHRKSAIMFYGPSLINLKVNWIDVKKNGYLAEKQHRNRTALFLNKHNATLIEHDGLNDEIASKYAC